MMAIVVYMQVTATSRCNHNEVVMFKRVLFGAALLSFAAAGPANAAFVLTVFDGATTISVTDNGAGDTDPTVGAINFSGGIGIFATNIAVGLSKPVIGSTTFGQMTIHSMTITSSAAGGMLVLTLSDDGFLGSGPTTFLTSTSGTLATTASFSLSSLVSGASLSSLGPFGPNTAFSGSTSGIANLSSPYSLSLVSTLNVAAGSTSDISIFDASVTQVRQIPEPATLAIFGAGLVFLGFAARRRRSVR